MPSINLIAARREEKRRTEQHIRRLFYTIACEIGVILVVSSIMVAKIVGEHNRISQLDGQIRLMQAKVNDIQDLQQETAALKPKVSILNEARNNTLYWYTAMQTVASCLPEQAWLTSLGTAGDAAMPPPKASGGKPAPAGPSPTLTITGQASDSDEVGLTMLKMNQFPNIDTVTLNSVTQSATGGAKTMMFNLAVQLKPNSAADADSSALAQAPAAQLGPAALPSGAAPVRQAAVGAPIAAKGVTHA